MPKLNINSKSICLKTHMQNNLFLIESVKNQKKLCCQIFVVYKKI